MDHLTYTQIPASDYISQFDMPRSSQALVACAIDCIARVDLAFEEDQDDNEI